MAVVRIEDSEGLSCDAKEDCEGKVVCAIVTEYSDTIKLCSACAEVLCSELKVTLYA